MTKTFKTVRTTYGKSTRTVVLNRPLQLLILLELSRSGYLDTIKKIKKSCCKELFKKNVILQQVKT